MLWELVREWVGIMNDAFAEPRMAEIGANLAQTYFAWSGPTTNGSAAYFRVQGPTLVIEYAPRRAASITSTRSTGIRPTTTVRNLRSSAVGALTLLLVLMSGSWTSAHRRDEYLQAARLGIDPDRVELELDLTAGIAVAEVVLSEIDLDKDGMVSVAEARAYLDRVLSAIALDVDGIPLRVELVESTFPTFDTVRKGEGTTRIQATASMPRLDDGLHHLRYRNAYRSDIGVYLANALVPASDRVIVAAQRRDVNQRDLVIDYMLSGQRTPTARRGLSVGVAGAIILIANVWWRTRIAGGRTCDEPP